MTLPSTSNWSLDCDQVISSALRRLPGKQDQGYDLVSAKEALQFTFNKLAARNLHNWKIDLGTLSLTDGDEAYTLPADEHDILEATIRDTTQATPTDIPLGRIARDAYHLLPDKTTAGQPTSFYVERGRTTRTVYFWPVPNTDNFQVRYQRVTLFRDVGSMVEELDAPASWHSVLVAGCAWYLALSKPSDVPMDERNELERLFEKEIEEISPVERDRADLRILPDLSSYFGRG